jgi:surface antigen
MKVLKLGVVSVVVSILAGCAGNGGGPLVTSRPANRDVHPENTKSVALAALADAYVGAQVMRALDRQDRRIMEETIQRTLESAPAGRQVTWRNPQSGHSGAITPQPGFTDEAGRRCREFAQTVTIEGKTSTSYGAACRRPDGAWRNVRS